MTAREHELRFQRMNTAAFINANPSSIDLIPRVRHKDGRGTRWVDQTARGIQVLRVIDQSSTRGPVPGTVQASDGQQRLVEYQLLGNHDAIIGLYDYWIDPDTLQRWEVADLLPNNGYEIRAQVVRYGE